MTKQNILCVGTAACLALTMGAASAASLEMGQRLTTQQLKGLQAQSVTVGKQQLKVVTRMAVPGQPPHVASQDRIDGANQPILPTQLGAHQAGHLELSQVAGTTPVNRSAVHDYRGPIGPPRKIVRGMPQR